MLKKLIRILGGDPNKRAIERYSKFVDQVNALENGFAALTDEALAAKTEEFRSRLRQDETLDDLMVEAFAAVREASKRTIGLRHYDVQLIGGMVLHQGNIAEMRTGEGKTLVATLPLYLNALTGKGVHLITVNDYLARRDARWMSPIYNLLGLSVGVLQIAARTENGKKAFLIDLRKESPHEDQHHLMMVPRREAYAADIIYGTNSEFGFDYLRDNMVMDLEDKVQRGHYYAIVDEVDNVLIDEARTPLIISGPAQDQAERYVHMAQIMRALHPEDYEVNEKDRTVTLTEVGEVHIEELLGMSLGNPDDPEDITFEQERTLGDVEQALRAQFLFKRNEDYLVQSGKVVIIDEFTGRQMPGRRWSDGLHQAVEAKEGVKVESESVTYATITIQNYFRMYDKLAGMTGTALTEAEEFHKIYNLNALPIPTNLEYQASRLESDLTEVDARDEDGYKYQYYARKGDLQKTPVFWRRKDYPDVVYRTVEAKLRAITTEILRSYALGRPVLVGTTSVDVSERVSSRLNAEPLRRLMQVTLLRAAWMQQNPQKEEGIQIPELNFLNVPLDNLDIAEMRRKARELDISFNPADANNLLLLLIILQLDSSQTERLKSALMAGIPHQVLNARKHTEESQIIAGAGAFGAVTIATNMAGRGVDIKLGGEMAEEVITAVNRVLNRAGYSNPYEMSLEQRRHVLLALDKSAYGIYESEVNFFFKYLNEMEEVRRLGGLHVIGSERHEARRIDNQLRGRAARQGDPGSSRFYLSMEDELMRLFGGQQADQVMQRLKIDDALPLEIGLVGRLIEQAQSRVEGANFDTRKHLLEYDDVLNKQRASIYAQRNRIFSKEDLTDDVADMLHSEITRRLKQAEEDETSYWKLLVGLDQMQPPMSGKKDLFPSYSMRLAIDHLNTRDIANGDRQALRVALLEIGKAALEAEREHALDIVDDLLEQTEEKLNSSISERMEALDNFIEGLTEELTTSETGGERKPAELAEELSVILGTSVKNSLEYIHSLRANPKEFSEKLREILPRPFVRAAVFNLLALLHLRLGEPLELENEGSQFSLDGWDDLQKALENSVNVLFDRRQQRYFDASGAVVKDLDAALARLPEQWEAQHLFALFSMMQRGTRAAFDKKTHRRMVQQTWRFSYIYFLAQLLEQREMNEITAEVIQHLDRAHQFRRDELGTMVLTAIYRHLLLRVINELWIDYLTQMESLRVSIGLEAYAQRDPLVQYKSQASALYQKFLSNMRKGVVERMFTYYPQNLQVLSSNASGESGTQEEIPDAEDTNKPFKAGGVALLASDGIPEAATSIPSADSAEQTGKRRRRRRH